VASVSGERTAPFGTSVSELENASIASIALTTSPSLSSAWASFRSASAVSSVVVST